MHSNTNRQNQKIEGKIIVGKLHPFAIHFGINVDRILLNKRAKERKKQQNNMRNFSMPTLRNMLINVYSKLSDV